MLISSYFQIVDKETNSAAIVDPVNPDRVLEAVKEHNVNLTAILTTHHHWDHAGDFLLCLKLFFLSLSLHRIVGGNEELVKKFDSTLKVYGGDDRIGALTNKVKQDDIINIGSLKIRCLFTPCHTTGHICYYVEAPSSGDKSVFTGENLKIFVYFEIGISSPIRILQEILYFWVVVVDFSKVLPNKCTLP